MRVYLLFRKGIGTVLFVRPYCKQIIFYNFKSNNSICPVVKFLNAIERTKRNEHTKLQYVSIFRFIINLWQLASKLLFFFLIMLLVVMTF